MGGPRRYHAGATAALPPQRAAVGMRGVGGGVVRSVEATVKALRPCGPERRGVVLSRLVGAAELVPGSGEPGAQAVCR